MISLFFHSFTYRLLGQMSGIVLFCFFGFNSEYGFSQNTALAEPIMPVYVIHESWHTGLIVKRENIRDPLLSIMDDVRDFPFIEFGWGDEEFFQSADPTVWTAIRAVAWPTSSVMHVYGFHSQPEKRTGAKAVYFVSLQLSDFEKLCRFIYDCFALDSLHRPQPTSSYGNTFFYKANGDYHLFNMCNHWTAKALEQAGCPISSAGAFTAESVMDQVGKFGTRVKPPAKIK